MEFARTGLNRNVYWAYLPYRVFMSYGEVSWKASFIALLSFEKKILINTGTIENQSEIEAILKEAGTSFSEIDFIINMDSRPENIGLNAVIQYQNAKARFFSHPEDILFIEDTVLQHEKRYVPGFYKLVSGNTRNVEALKDGQNISLGEESLKIRFQMNHSFQVYLRESGMLIGASGWKSRLEKKRPLLEESISHLSPRIPICA
jgi:hypothetical protein